MKRKLSEDKVQEMLTLFLQGWQQSFLARKYELDHSTVYYYIKKHNVVRSENVKIYIPTKEEHIFISGVKTPIEKPVKMYADLLRESQQRAQLRKFRNPQANLEILKMLTQ